MYKRQGYEVVDLGIDVTPERFLGALDETQADCVGMSAMLTTTMTVMKEVAEAMKADPKYDHVKIMILSLIHIWDARYGAKYGIHTS